jgi:hypothetical protein
MLHHAGIFRYSLSLSQHLFGVLEPRLFLAGQGCRDQWRVPQTIHLVVSIAPAIIAQSLLVRGCRCDLLPPSPPAEQATARQDQAGNARACNRSWGVSWRRNLQRELSPIGWRRRVCEHGRHVPEQPPIRQRRLEACQRENALPPHIERGVSVNIREEGRHAECPCQAAIRAGCDAGQAARQIRIGSELSPRNCLTLILHCETRALKRGQGASCEIWRMVRSIELNGLTCARARDDDHWPHDECAIYQGCFCRSSECCQRSNCSNQSSHVCRLSSLVFVGSQWNCVQKILLLIVASFLDAVRRCAPRTICWKGSRRAKRSSHVATTAGGPAPRLPFFRPDCRPSVRAGPNSGLTTALAAPQLEISRSSLQNSDAGFTHQASPNLHRLIWSKRNFWTTRVNL